MKQIVRKLLKIMSSSFDRKSTRLDLSPCESNSESDEDQLENDVQAVSVFLNSQSAIVFIGLVNISMSSTLRGKHLHAQAREMAFNVYQWIISQNEDQYTKEIKENLSKATGVSVRTTERIIKERSTSPEAETDKRFKIPEKKKQNSVSTVTALEDYELRDFRNMI
ncbi:hypothetical protein FQA39_LY05991 [Lamprigera yunnana]|nr:hypothetical protein FQA39_LY05991 [Lamprigera yunnana]